MDDLRSRLGAAKTAYDTGNFEQAFGLYRAIAEAGNTEAQVFVAWMLTKGVGCQADEAEAEDFYERAAALGSAIGSFYHGRWLTRSGDHAGAYRMYLVGARAKYVPSICRVGHSLVRGKGVAQDLKKGYAFLTEAALRGHVFALREIAVQDWKGSRGVLGRAFSLLLFPVVVVYGLIIGLFDGHSDRFRA